MAPRTCHTRKHFYTCGSSGAHASQSAVFCVISKKCHPHGRISCRTLIAHGLIGYLFFCGTALRLYSILQTGPSSAFRNKDFRLAFWPNRVCSQVMSPTILWRLAVRKLRRCSCPRKKQALVRLTTLATTSPLHPALSEVDERSDLGMLASPQEAQERDKCSPIQDSSLLQRKF